MEFYDGIQKSADRWSYRPRWRLPGKASIGPGISGSWHQQRFTGLQHQSLGASWNSSRRGATLIGSNDFRSVLKTLTVTVPEEIYNLAGQTSVGLSFEQPVECMESIAGGTLNFLESLRYLGLPSRFFSAGSSECFGDTGPEAANEASAFQPRSPYAVAKSAAFWQVANYREAYGIYCCTGVLANHESPLRPSRFVTQKIITGVQAIKAGTEQHLRLGNLDIWRDWGWAPDYVQAMHLMLQQSMPADFIIATGRTNSLRDFVDAAFLAVGLNSSAHLQTDSRFFRPSDLKYSAMDPTRIHSALGWKASLGLQDIIDRMMEGSIDC